VREGEGGWGGRGMERTLEDWDVLVDGRHDGGWLGQLGLVYCFWIDCFWIDCFVGSGCAEVWKMAG
jgi:hypothetical protein